MDTWWAGSGSKKGVRLAFSEWVEPGPLLVVYIAMGTRVFGAGRCPLHSSCRGQQQGLLHASRCPKMVEGPEKGSKINSHCVKEMKCGYHGNRHVCVTAESSLSSSKSLSESDSSANSCQRGQRSDYATEERYAHRSGWVDLCSVLVEIRITTQDTLTHSCYSLWTVSYHWWQARRVMSQLHSPASGWRVGEDWIYG